MIKKTTVDNYARLLDQQADEAAAKVLAFARGLDWTTYMDRHYARTQLTEYAYNLLLTYGDNASTIAARVYEALAHEMGVEIGTAQLAEPLSYGTCIKHVHEAIGDIGSFDKNNEPWPIDVSKMAQKVSSTVSTDVYHSANRTIDKNLQAYDGEAYYQRVPRSAHPCAFCVMLSGLGGHYSTAEKAVHVGKTGNKAYHPGCRCIAVPVFGKGSIEGHDPGAFRDKFNKVADTISDDAVKGELESMSVGELKELKKKADKAHQNPFWYKKTAMTLAEMRKTYGGMK